MFVLPLAFIFLAACVATAAYVFEPSPEAKHQAALQQVQQHVDQLRRTIAANDAAIAAGMDVPSSPERTMADIIADTEIAREQLPHALKTLAAARAAAAKDQSTDITSNRWRPAPWRQLGSGR